jgi:hypothetical protein
MNFLINKSATNDVYLTLNEKVTITSPVFLFRLIFEDGSSEKAFICEDTTSGLIERYNKFVIEENSTEDLLNGVVSLKHGTYYYMVYAQSSTTNLDYTLATELVEQGLCDVRGNESTFNKYEPTIITKSYDPNE